MVQELRIIFNVLVFLLDVYFSVEDIKVHISINLLPYSYTVYC